MTNTSIRPVASTEQALSLLDKPPPELAKLATKVGGLTAIANAYVIDSQDMYQAAASDLVAWRAELRDLEAQRQWLKAPYLEGGRRVDAMFDLPKKALEEAGKVLNTKMSAYKAEQDRIAAEERRKEEERLRKEREELEARQKEHQRQVEAARKEAEEAQRKIDEQAAEQRRIAEELAEKARKQGDEQAALQAEKDAIAAQKEADRQADELRQRQAAQDEINAAAADEIQQDLDIAAVAPAPVLAIQETKAVGVSARKTWKVRSIDKAVLVKAAAAALEAGDDSLLIYLTVDEKALNGIARSSKGQLRVPGVAFYEDTSIAATGRRG